MARFRGSPRGRAIPSRRRVSAWTVGVGGTTGSATIVGNNAIFLGSAVVLVALEAVTVVRIRGQFLGYLLTAASAGDGFRGAVGIGIATTAAVTAGIGSVPTPLTEQDADNWLWHQYFALTTPAAIVAADAVKEASNMAVVTGAFRTDIDSRAMRKFRSQDSLYASVEIIETGTATAQFSLDSRMLVKLA